MCCLPRLGFVGVLLSMLFGRGGCCPTDLPVQITLEAAPASISVVGGTATVTATLDAPFTDDLILHLRVAKTLGAMADVELSAADITIPAGQTEGSVTMTVQTLPEGNGYVRVDFSIRQISTTDCQWDVDVPDESVTITQPPGALQVTLEPAGAVTAGAQWNVDGGAWQDSGAAITGLAAGTYTVSYKAVAGWTAPASEIVTVTNGQTTAITRAYTQVHATLQVTLLPTDAAEAGARWSLDGVEFHDSGFSYLLPAGTYTISYGDVAGYAPPAAEQVTVPPGESVEITRNYTPEIPTTQTAPLD